MENIHADVMVFRVYMTELKFTSNNNIVKQSTITYWEITKLHVTTT